LQLLQPVHTVFNYVVILKSYLTNGGSACKLTCQVAPKPWRFVTLLSVGL